MIHRALPIVVAFLSLNLPQSAESRIESPGYRNLKPLASGRRSTLFGLPRSRVGSAFTGHSRDILDRLRAGNQEDEDSDSESEEGEKDEEETKGENNEEDERKEDTTSKTSKEDDARLSMPVPVVVQAKLSRRESTILDHKVEITLQRRRTVANLKENLRKGLPGKPPVALMKIIHEGRILDDSVLLNDLVDEEDEDEEEEDEDSAAEAKGTLHLTLDMIPPVDGKFAQAMPSQLPDLTTSELLRLFASNEAALQETSLLLYGETSKKEDDDDGDQTAVSTPPILSQIIPKIEERADKIESQLKELLGPQQDGKVRAILEETRPPSAIQPVTEIRGERVRDAIPSRGVKTSLRRKIQHTFNVQSWADTIRYICLFVFFGMFGGRTPVSRLILLLGAPSVLILQARPVKLLWKQVLYTLINDPPGILLSLLPAPQQALFHLDKEKEMEIIYGPYTTETKDLVSKTKTKTLSRPTKSNDESIKTSRMDEEAEEEFFDAEEEEFSDAEKDGDAEDETSDEDDDSDDE